MSTDMLLSSSIAKHKLETMEDLVKLEKCLRVIYKTIDGETCQALMTLEYVSWRNKVVRQLAYERATSSCESEPLCAFLPGNLCGYKLYFNQGNCSIFQLIPSQCQESMTRKRKLNEPMKFCDTTCKHTRI
jgi:hypothetical protein